MTERRRPCNLLMRSPMLFTRLVRVPWQFLMAMGPRLCWDWFLWVSKHSLGKKLLIHILGLHGHGEVHPQTSSQVIGRYSQQFFLIPVWFGFFALKPNRTEPSHLHKTKTKPNCLWTFMPFKPNQSRKGKPNHLNQNRLGKSLNNKKFKSNQI